jgi:hypothetical protein
MDNLINVQIKAKYFILEVLYKNQVMYTTLPKSDVEIDKEIGWILKEFRNFSKNIEFNIIPKILLIEESEEYKRDQIMKIIRSERKD